MCVTWDEIYKSESDDESDEERESLIASWHYLMR